MAGSSFGGEGGQMDLKRFFTQPIVLLLFGAVIVAVGFFWYRNRQQSGASAAQAGVVANPVTGAMQSGNSDVLATAQLNGIQQQLSNLLQQVSSIGSQPTSGNGAQGPTAVVASSGTPNVNLWQAGGAGYTYEGGQTFTLNGKQYYHVLNASQEQALEQQGSQLYYAPAPGILEPFSGPNPGSGVTGLPPGGTAIYAAV